MIQKEFCYNQRLEVGVKCTGMQPSNQSKIKGMLNENPFNVPSHSTLLKSKTTMYRGSDFIFKGNFSPKIIL
jgi:hypothetical protein